MHAVHQLHQYRKSISTTTYKARGQRVIRCPLCQLAKQFCICEISPNKEQVESTAGFLLLMYDTEVLKPSNTGKLIADLIPDTYAFLWSRTQENLELLEVLNDDKWFPLVVFPQEYADDERKVFTNNVICPEGKRPLFIMLDGSWREAKKMFRKSPYLDGFPVLAFDPDNIEQNIISSRYQIRSASVNNQFATAEVAARVLALSGDTVNANLLDLWFDVFSYQYQKSVCQVNKGNPEAIEQFIQFKTEQGLNNSKSSE